MKFLKEYFVFSSSERRGIFLFTILLFLLVIAYFLMPFYTQNKTTVDSEVRKEIDQLLAQSQKEQTNNTVDTGSLNFFQFNPNTLSLEGFVRLGLSQKQAKTIINYRSKGGHFYKKEDFKKIYGITNKLYNQLEPYIVLSTSTKETFKTEPSESFSKDSLFYFNPNIVTKEELVKLGFSSKQANTFINYRDKGGKFYKPEDVKKVYGVTNKLFEKISPYIELPKSNYTVKQPKQFEIEINTATAEEFKQIKGIGEKISVRIVNYRDKLGGFCSVEHLAEVYGVEIDLVQKNLSHLTIDKSKIKKINLNTITINDFYKHPYISFNDARKIVNFREVHGLFTTVNEIKTNDLVKDEVYSKIVNYLIL